MITTPNPPCAPRPRHLRATKTTLPPLPHCSRTPTRSIKYNGSDAAVALPQPVKNPQAIARAILGGRGGHPLFIVEGLHYSGSVRARPP